jgi:hypothetical protein
MLDDPSTLLARDTEGLLDALTRLPSRVGTPDRPRPAPLGFDATGATAVLVPVLAPWVDGRLVAGGTQVLVDGGFQSDDVAVWRLAAEASGSEVVFLGAPGDADDDVAAALGVTKPAPDVVLEDGPVVAFDVVRLIAHAAGRHEDVARLEQALTEVATACAPIVATEQNPAKALAWRLYQRVPLLVAPRGGAPLQGWVQQVFARVGKMLAVPTGDHPSLVAASAFEARHALADDLVALVLGSEDAETRIVAEVLETRAADLERLTLGAGGWPASLDEPVLDAIVVAYAATWVAAYVALLGELDPSRPGVYAAVQAAAAAEARSGR